MTNVQETKGFLAIRGKVFGLDNKEAFENDYKKSLSFGINTTKENGIFVTVGGWKNSTLTVNIKGEGMDKPVKINEQEAIDEIQGLFKNGDSVFVGLRAEFNTYSKRIDYIINKIYVTDDEIDFDSKDFEEKNELDVSAIITAKIDGDKQKVAFATYKGDILEQELTVLDKDMNDYFLNEVNVGDIVPVMLKVVRKPIYEEVKEEDKKEDKPAEKVRKTFKGKTVGETKQKKRGKIIDNIDLLEVADIDIEEVKKGVYAVTDLGLENDDTEEDMPF